MFLLLFNQLTKMLIILIVAIICYKIGLINQEGNKNISNLLLMVVNPCLIVNVYQMEYDPVLVKGLLISFAFAILSHILCILISSICIRKTDNPDFSIERFCSIYSNCGFMGIPLINSVLGAEGVFYLSAYMAVFNIFTWTHGLVLINGKFSSKKLYEGLRSPVMIGTIIGMILYFAKIAIPGTLLSPIQYISDMNTPLAMMVAGFSVAQADFKSVFANFKVYKIAVFKLLINPIAFLLLLWIAKVPATVAYTILIATACPTATNATLMAIRFGKNYKYASQAFAFTTVVCILTIPLIALIAGYLIPIA
ncbi:MAG: AEC family transporter [Eubacteriales bacterium]|nr:AEC family transporter [Eubacteriales bacterium]